MSILDNTMNLQSLLNKANSLTSKDTILTVDQATPSISVNSSGLITASATQEEGYVEAGTKSATKQLTTQRAKTWTPTTTNQTLSSGRYLTGAQIIKGDSNLVASNIKSGVSIFGVAGSYEGNGSSSSGNGVDIFNGMHSTEMCSLECRSSLSGASIVFFQRNNKTNCIDMKCVSIEDETVILNDIPSNSIIIISVPYSTGDPFMLDGSMMELIDSFDIEIIGHRHYHVYLINGNSIITSNSKNFFDAYSISRQGDTGYFSLSNSSTYAYGVNESYTTTIETGIHGINTVTVTMGGVDMTNTAYDGHDKIHIDSVTGDIVITVTVAMAENLVPTSTTEPNGTEIYNGTGYMENYRWSSSSNGTVSYSGGRMTGWMPFVSGSKYLLKNFNPKSGYANGLYVVYQNASGTNAASVTNLTSNSNYNVDVTNDTVEILLKNSTYKYFRVSGYSGDDVPEIYRVCSITASGDTGDYTLTNSDTEILQGLKYETGIKNYNDADMIFMSIDSITVTMDGIDITDSVVGEMQFETFVGMKTIPKVTIPNVTGNVIITVESSIEDE